MLSTVCGCIRTGKEANVHHALGYPETCREALTRSYRDDGSNQEQEQEQEREHASHPFVSFSLGVCFVSPSGHAVPPATSVPAARLGQMCPERRRALHDG